MNKGWTNDLISYKWLKTYFDPSTRRSDSIRRHLFIDSYSSYITTRFIAFYISKEIDLLFLPPHTSHITQPLDLSIFGPFKTALTLEVDTLFQITTRRVQRVKWTQAFIRARNRSFRPSNIELEFRKAGIYPFQPEEVLLALRPPPRTPSPETTIISHPDEL